MNRLPQFTIPLTAMMLAGMMLFTSAPPSLTTAAAEPVDPGAGIRLSPGENAFWDGPSTGEVVLTQNGFLNTLYRGQIADELCEEGTSCFDFPIEVLESAWRLRVAVDAPWEGGSEIDLTVTSPTGERAFSTWSYSGTIPPRSQEVFIDADTPGTYVARLVIYFADHVSLRLRAMLEESPVTGVGEKLPDLRAEPPFDFAFESDGTADVPIKCYPDETLEDGATRCMRFSFGWQNVGTGAMDLRFLMTSPGATVISGPVAQRIHNWEGGFSDEPGAGTYGWHASHNHYHYEQFLSGALYRVLDEDLGTVVPVAPLRKFGGCSHDWKMTEWSRFVQDPAGGDSGAACGLFATGLPTQTHLALSAGWFDVYSAGTPDNYVDLGVNGDGLYLMRVTIDPDGNLREVREDNNVGYALVRVEGATISLVERGQGRDPWDAAKVVFPASP